MGTVPASSEVKLARTEVLRAKADDHVHRGRGVRLRALLRVELRRLGPFVGNPSRRTYCTSKRLMAELCIPRS